MNSLGIDVSKVKIDVCLLVGNKIFSATFDNDSNGFEKLNAWLSKKAGDTATHVCMEATGKYQEPLAMSLHEAKYLVSVVNPVQIKSYAKMTLNRTKTDRSDAKLIAQFCQSHKPEAWTPKPSEIRELEGYLSLLNALKNEHTRWLNRLQAPAQTDEVLKLMQQHYDHLEAEIKQLEKRIHDHIQQHESLKVDAELLDTIPGLGPATIAWLLSIRLRTFDNAKAVTAYAGVCPAHNESGTSVKSPSHMSKVGDAQLRKALYMPILSALRHNPIIKAMRERLLKAGKKEMVIIGAAMRKLLTLAYGVLKSGKSFDPNFAKSNLKPA